LVDIVKMHLLVLNTVCNYRTNRLL